MQLSRRLGSAALAVGLFLAAPPAHADDLTTRISSEVAGYADTVGVSVFTPSAGASVESPTAGWEANGRYLVDIVSAASPDIVATASPRWHEVRHAGSLGARYKPGTIGLGLGANASTTPDYLALAGSAQLIEELDEKNLTLFQGYSFGQDTIGRTGTPFTVFSRDLTTHAFSAGLSRIANKGLVLGGFGDLIVESGDQSKPYRYVPMFAPEIAGSIPRGASAIDVADNRIAARPLEQLPLSRTRVAFTGRVAFRGETTTLRLDQRLYDDSWSLKASTTDVRWLVDVAERVTVWPHLRAHVQSGADFWKRAYASRGATDVPSLRTGDRELGPLSSFGVGGGIRLALGRTGSAHDVVLGFSADGTWTSFADALYVKNRFAALGACTLQVTP